MRFALLASRFLRQRLTIMRESWMLRWDSSMNWSTKQHEQHKNGAPSKRNNQARRSQSNEKQRKKQATHRSLIKTHAKRTPHARKKIQRLHKCPRRSRVSCATVHSWPTCSEPPRRTMVAVRALGQPVNKFQRSLPSCLSSNLAQCPTTSGVMP